MLSYHILDIPIRTSLLYTPVGPKEHDAPHPEMKAFARCDDPNGLRGIKQFIVYYLKQFANVNS